LTFESGSKLARIELFTLQGCSSLESFCLPASISFLGLGALHSCYSLSSLTFESGSKLAQIEACPFVRCSRLKALCLPASVQFLGERCFWLCDSLSELTFESRSKLSRIDAEAFYDCRSLTSILIPQSVRELRKGWTLHSSLREVTFESALSLRRMIERNTIDLSGA
jgi:hypothetical protein